MKMTVRKLFLEARWHTQARLIDLDEANEGTLSCQEEIGKHG
jgi:hypothetical protein